MRKKPLVLLIESLEPRRLFATGGLDPNFGDGGKVAANIRIPESEEAHLAIQPDGGIIAVTADVVARYTAAGNLDLRFGIGGKVADPALDLPSTLALQADGKPLVGSGLNQADNDSDPNNTPPPLLFLITRYATNGKIDKTFGDRGRVVVTDPDGKPPFAAKGDLIVQPDGKILLRTFNLLRRYLADGSPDPSFGGGDGVAELPENFSAHEIAIAPTDQKIVLAGTTSTARWGVGYYGEPDTTPYYTQDTTYVRLNADATLDTTFADEGRLYFDSEDENFAHPPNVPVQILVGGDGKIIGTSATKYWRLTAAGEFDPTFGGGDGLVDMPEADTHFASGSAIVLQSDGKLLAGGAMFKLPMPTQPFDLDQIVRRFNTDGSIDTTFGDNGKATIELGVTSERVNRLLLAPDGTVLVGGVFTNAQKSRRLTLARLWRDNGPVAQAVAPAVLAEQSTPYRFRINWRDDEALDLSSIDNGDIKAIGPDGSVRKAYVVGADTTDDSPSFAMNLKVAAPGGGWDAGENGVWTLRVLSNHVTDTDGNAMRGRILATFRVNIPAAATPAQRAFPPLSIWPDDDEADEKQADELIV